MSTLQIKTDAGSAVYLKKFLLDLYPACQVEISPQNSQVTFVKTQLANEEIQAFLEIMAQVAENYPEVVYKLDSITPDCFSLN